MTSKICLKFTKQGELLPKNQRFSNPCLNFKVQALKTPEEDIFIREKRYMFIHLVASVVNPSMREPLHGHQ